MASSLVDQFESGRAGIAQVGARRPLVVGFGGTIRPDSSSERALRVSLAAAEAAGAQTILIPASELDFPMYRPGGVGTAASDRFVDAIRRSDGIVIATPGYHGGVSGLVKNALDYVEDLREDERPYFDGRAVGCICCAYGWQATTTTLTSLRSIVHALRGWPTPVGAAVNSAEADADRSAHLELVGRQVVQFAEMLAGTS